MASLPDETIAEVGRLTNLVDSGEMTARDAIREAARAGHVNSIANIHERLLTVNQIAEKIGLSPATVYERIKARGIEAAIPERGVLYLLDDLPRIALQSIEDPRLVNYVDARVRKAVYRVNRRTTRPLLKERPEIRYETWDKWPRIVEIKLPRELEKVLTAHIEEEGYWGTIGALGRALFTAYMEAQ